MCCVIKKAWAETGGQVAGTGVSRTGSVHSQRSGSAEDRTQAVAWSMRSTVPGLQARGLVLREGLHSKQGKRVQEK